MKKLLTFLLLVFSPLAMGSPIPDFPFLYVSGNASEEVPTESAKISLSVEKENKDSAIGEAEFQKACVALLALLKENGILQKDIESAGLSKSSRGNYTSKDSDQQIKFYFQQCFTVTLTDLTKYPKLAELFIESDVVSEFRAEFYGGNLSDVTKRLRVAAIKDAREKAETLSSASGTTLGNVHSISEYDYSELTAFIGSEVSGYANLPPDRTKIYTVPPTVTSSFSVRVLYRLAEPKK